MASTGPARKFSGKRLDRRENRDKWDEAMSAIYKIVLYT